MEKIAVIYARVSTAKQKEGETVQSQVVALQKYAKDNNYKVPAGCIFIDEGVTGSRLQRPALDCLRELIREGDIDAVLVYSPDRLSRKYAFQILLEDEFQKQNVELLYFNSPKASTPEEQLSVHFRSIFAEYERAQIVERSRRGRNHKAKQGCVSVLSRAPYGYEYIRKTNEEPAKYNIHFKHSQVVKKIYSCFVNDRLALREICSKLHSEGILPPNNLKQWYPSTVRGILLNPAYTGTTYFGKTQMSEGCSDRIVRVNGVKKKCAIKARKERSKEDWIPIPVPKLVEEDIFEIAQMIIIQNKKTSSRNTQEPSLLQGLIVCGECSHSFHKKTRTSGTRKLKYYICGGRIYGNNCKINSIRLDKLDDTVWEELMNLLRNPHLVENEIIRRANESQESIKSKRKQEEIEKELQRVARGRNKILDAYQDGDCLDLNELKQRMKILNQQKKVLENELNALSVEKINDEKIQNLKENMEKFIFSIDNSKNKLSIKEKQKVVRLLIDEIVITKDEVKINHLIPLGSLLSIDCRAIDLSPQRRRSCG